MLSKLLKLLLKEMHKLKKIHSFLFIAFIVLAITVRFAIFFQQRDLFIDEANVARNLFEKNYTELLGVLDYEQFAPPIFLWISKFFTSIFGFNELSLRLFPFLCSIGSVFLLAELMKTLINKKYTIYPLALFAGGFLFLHYSTELKQYSSDFLITIILLLIAIKTNKKPVNKQFIILWVLLGSFAIWISMPAVFILFSIGVYWFSKALLNYNYKNLVYYLIAPMFWLIQFGLYYFLLLKEQASSEYLQNYHADAFLSFEFSLAAIANNLSLIKNIIDQAGGYTFIAVLFNAILILLGIITIIKKKRVESILFILPFITLFLASFMNKYALVPRLLMFIQPIVFVVIAFGVYTIFQVKNKLLHFLFIALMTFNIISHQRFEFLFKNFEYKEIRFALDILQTTDNPILIYHGAKPSFIFYTDIYDNKEQYLHLKQNARFLSWESNYADEVKDIASGAPFYVLISGYYPEDLEKIKTQLAANKLITVTSATGSLLLEYKKAD